MLHNKCELFFKGLSIGDMQISIPNCNLLPKAFEMREKFLGIKER